MGYSFKPAMCPVVKTVVQALNAQRLWQRIEDLSCFTEPARPWTRRAFTPLHEQSRVWLQEQMQAAGMEVRQDEAGNLVGSLRGRDPDAPPVVTGSHSDTVVDGGRFDGIVGVLAGIELAHALQDAGVQPLRTFEVIDFLSEEPSDYGISCVGSRALAGVLEADMLASTNATGETLAQGIARIGGQPHKLNKVRRLPGSVAAFLELHIEQGPVLEARAIPIGVVSHLVGIRRVQITLQGRPDHAGTTPMDLRCDAMVAAARLIEACYQQAKALNQPDVYVVATVGRVDVQPNVPNAVPGRVEMVLELRSDQESVLASFPELLLQAQEEKLRELGVSLSTRELSRAPVTHCDPAIMQLIRDSARQCGYDSLTLPSGAGHDAVYMARIAPMGMVFVPCLNGRSHCSEEWLDIDQLMAGTQVLAASVMHLLMQ